MESTDSNRGPPGRDFPPDESLAAAAILQRAQDPAPYDDEELTDEDLRAVKEARSEPGISWQTLRRS